MGMDVTSLMSVPLFIMEPFSMLQKMAEIMEYTHLLDQANAAEDPYERYVLAQHAHLPDRHISGSGKPAPVRAEQSKRPRGCNAQRVD